jgi:hypothetical protein
MGYDSKGILVFNLKYEHAISFINLVKFMNYYQMPRSISSKLFVRGGYGFLFRSENLFRTKQELEYLLFLSGKARNFVSEFNIRLYDINSESDYFFFLHQNQNIFFSNIVNQNIFLEKNPTPPPPPFKLNGRSLIASGEANVYGSSCYWNFRT